MLFLYLNFFFLIGNSGLNIFVFKVVKENIKLIENDLKVKEFSFLDEM